MRTDDPIRDSMARDAEYELWLSDRPICQCCGEHIQDESAVYLDGKWYCDKCLKDNRRYIDD